MCRGKVSEGLDFSDENARAVVTVSLNICACDVIWVFQYTAGGNPFSKH